MSVQERLGGFPAWCLWGALVFSGVSQAAQPATKESVSSNGKPGAVTSAPIVSPSPPVAAGTPGTDTREAAVRRALERDGLGPRLQSLKLKQGTFLAILTLPRAVTKPRGALLLVPAAGAALSDLLPLTLASLPPKGGWVTLAVQPAPPVPSPDDGFCPRLAAGLAALKARADSPIALVAIGDGVDSAIACYARKFPPEIAALAGVGRWRSSLEDISIPVLDLVPSGDQAAREAAHRREISVVGRSGASYHQATVDVPNRGFQGGEEELAKRLRAWLRHVPTRAPSATATPPKV